RALRRGGAVAERAEALTLQRLVEALQSAVSLEAVLDSTVRVVPELVGVSQCSLFLVDDRDRRLLPVAASGVEPEAMPAFYALAGAPTIDPVRRAIETRQPVVARADGPDFGFPEAIAVRFRIRAILIVPLVAGAQVVGAL